MAAVVYVIEQTDQFQKLGKNLARNTNFKKSQKSDLNQKIRFKSKKSDYLIF